MSEPLSEPSSSSASSAASPRTESVDAGSAPGLGSESGPFTEADLQLLREHYERRKSMLFAANEWDLRVTEALGRLLAVVCVLDLKEEKA